MVNSQKKKKKKHFLALCTYFVLQTNKRTKEMVLKIKKGEKRTRTGFEKSSVPRFNTS